MRSVSRRTRPTSTARWSRSVRPGSTTSPVAAASRRPRRTEVALALEQRGLVAQSAAADRSLGGRATGRGAAGPPQRAPARARPGRAGRRPAGRGASHRRGQRRPGPGGDRRRHGRRRPAVPPAAARGVGGGRHLRHRPAGGGHAPRRTRRRTSRPLEGCATGSSCERNVLETEPQENLVDVLRREQQVRVVERVPTKLIIADSRTAMVPLDSEGGEPSALVVHAGGLVQSLVALFDSVWRDAWPLVLATPDADEFVEDEPGPGRARPAGAGAPHRGRLRRPGGETARRRPAHRAASGPLTHGRHEGDHANPAGVGRVRAGMGPAVLTPGTAPRGCPPDR